MCIFNIFNLLLAYEEGKWRKPFRYKCIINSLNLSGQLQVFSRFFGTSFLPCHLYCIVLKKWMSLFINTAGTWQLICITGSYLMDLYDEIGALLFYLKCLFFSKLLNLKELSFFVVCKKKNIFIKHEDSKSERRKRDQIFFKAIKHQYILFCISEWIKNKPSFKCWFSTIEETIFLFFFWQCFYDLLRMIKQSKSGVRVGTINRRITAPSQRPVDRKSREVKPPDSSSNGCCQIL